MNKNFDITEELKYDYNKYLNSGINIHRRLQFNKSKEYFYITMDSIQIEDYKFGNDYLLSYWGAKDTRRIEKLLKFEIGDESPANGELVCFGDFQPNGDDLRNVRYQCINGKYEFKSAKDTLKNKIKTYTKELIDINKFFRLKFNLADIGEQSKALYDKNNAIIDGSAGTGKSTIALQKLRYLSINKKISQDKMLIIVKNRHLKKDFKSLLEDRNLKLNDIKIKTVDELNPNIKSYKLDFLKNIKNQSIKIRKIFNNFISERNAIFIIKHYESLLAFFYNKNLLNNDENISLENIKEWQYKYTNSIYKNYFLAFEYLHRYKNYYDSIYRIENRKLEIKNRIQKLETKLNDKDLSDKEYEAYEKLEIELDKLEKREIEKYTNTKKENLILINILKKLYFNKKYIDNYLSTMPNYEKELVLKYLNLGEYEYNTILIDEAQDYSRVELEIIRLYTHRVILTGDILQNIDGREISDWRDILYVDEIYGIENRNGENKLNIFTLKHNFRQTYQLANASYNFRQLLLNKYNELEDIESEYYLSEKELNGKPYNKPIILFKQNIKEYINKKIKHIKNTFTSQVPIVLIYKTNKEKESYQQKLATFRLSYDTEKIENIDVILIDILEAKGKQFPIVVSNLNILNDREIYLVMTRGQFEVEFLCSKQEVDNRYLKILKEKNWIETRDIKFISQEILQKSVNNKKSKSIDSYKNSKLNKDKVFEKNKYLNNNQIKKSNNEEQILPKTKEQILKHKKDTNQYDEELDPDVITNGKQYQKDFIKKIQKDIKEFDKGQQNEIIKEIIIVRKKSINKQSKELRDNIKNYLMKTYKGYCQICGFSFRKVSDGKNYFEMFNWNDKRVVKQKKSFITTADSLCLCSNCSANIKWGDFNPIFIDKINNIDDFLHKDLDEIKDIICVELEDEVVDRFKEDYQWNEIYALEILINGKSKNIYFTNGHLIQFIAYLQLEER